MTSTVRQSGPPPALVKMGNPLVRMILGSPLHGLLADSLLVLHLTGRKSGRVYHIPVAFVDMDEEGNLLVATTAKWRVNLRGQADVQVTLDGRLHSVHARLEEDPAAVAVSYQDVIDRIGWRKAQRRLRISSSSGRAPTVTELKDAAVSYGWSVITLTLP